MNGIEKITQRIAAEAEAECGRITAEAEQRCAAIRAEYDAKAAQVYESAMAKGKQEIEQLSSREEGTVRMDAKKDLLLLKQELVQEAFSRAKEKILSMPREEYADFAAKLAASAASTVPAAHAVHSAPAAAARAARCSAAFFSAARNPLWSPVPYTTFPPASQQASGVSCE